MGISKHPLVPERLRRPPREGWSWIDRRFLRQYAASLSAQAITLYFFLAAVSDKHGLSFYSDVTTAARLRLGPQAVREARQELVAHDLVAYRHPLTQVLSLPPPRPPRGGEPASLGDILRALGQRGEAPRPSSGGQP